MCTTPQEDLLILHTMLLLLMLHYDIIPYDHHFSLLFAHIHIHRGMRRSMAKMKAEDRGAEGESKREWENFRKKYKISQTYPITFMDRSTDRSTDYRTSAKCGIRVGSESTYVHTYTACASLTRSIIAVWDQSVGGRWLCIIAWL